MKYNLVRGKYKYVFLSLKENPFVIRWVCFYFICYFSINHIPFNLFLTRFFIFLEPIIFYCFLCPDHANPQPVTLWQITLTANHFYGKSHSRQATLPNHTRRDDLLRMRLATNVANFLGNFTCRDVKYRKIFRQRAKRVSNPQTNAGGYVPIKIYFLKLSNVRNFVKITNKFGY